MNRFRLPAPLILTLLLLLLSLPVRAQDGDSPGPTETPIATALPPDLTPTALPRPEPVQVLEQDGVTLALYFEEIPQGRAGLLHITGEKVTGARARFRDRVTDFFPVEGDGYFGLIAVGMEQAIRSYDLEVYALLPDEERVTFQTQVDVSNGGFIGQTLDLPPERAYLIDPEVERTEFARLTAIFQTITPEVLWRDTEPAYPDFQYPINAAISSPFGAVRLLNGTVETRHTGWDLRASTGTPVTAMADGKIAFAGTLDIRGNVVIVDHGYGLFSAYAHFSVINVVRGQEITRGQVLGMSGNTGRSSGPHLHWEINLNGEWIDSVDFMQMWIP